MSVDSGEMVAGVVLRPLGGGDAEALAAAYVRNREHLAPWEPVRPGSFFTPGGQRERIEGLLRQRDEGSVVPWVFEEADGRIVGTITLTGISRGPFCSAYLGYWVAGDREGRGLASAAVARVCGLARDAVGLHRIEASTLVENAGSQRVLEKCGFELIGTAPKYLHINGRWRDSRLFQRILHGEDPAL
ncbi:MULTISPECIES: GNAT family N-acetyltransferase [unclassified Streptomyces]|uniref:GNAT family N-acetyltransferase n=1 Tax=unclassified Streptomyces TaxID=2593676 RepID=UPI001318DA3E|nr:MULTISPECIES: GNAT family protein [unclassified Streptomyces]QHC30297.1 GNAT family N-acetyltransferase [Streptomyces sp. HF10]WKE70805.1 GNAT family protein [Streptomyces sp. WP-1]